jgi:hypothetical protein
VARNGHSVKATGRVRGRSIVASCQRGGIASALAANDHLQAHLAQHRPPPALNPSRPTIVESEQRRLRRRCPRTQRGRRHILRSTLSTVRENPLNELRFLDARDRLQPPAAAHALRTGNPSGAHGATNTLAPTALDQLVEYLNQIEPGTP